MKKLILFAGLVGLLVACGEEEVVKPKGEPKEEVPAAVEPKEEAPSVEEPKEEAPAIEEPKEEAPPAVEPKEEAPPPVQKGSIDPQVALSILQDAYQGIAKVEYNAQLKAFLILPTDPNFIVEMEMILTGKMSKDDWNYLADSIAKLSGELGPEYLVFLLNPANPDNYILMAENGVIKYDALNEDVKSQDKAL